MKYTYLLILLTSYATITLSAQKPLQQQAVNLLNRLIAPHLRAVAISLNDQDTPVLLPDNCQDPIQFTIRKIPGFFQIPISAQVISLRHFATYLSLMQSVNQPNNRLFFEKLWNLTPATNNLDTNLPEHQIHIPNHIIRQESMLMTLQETSCPICLGLVLMPPQDKIMNQNHRQLLEQCQQTLTPDLCKAHQEASHREKLKQAIQRNNQRRATLLDNLNTNMDDRLTNQPPVK